MVLGYSQLCGWVITVFLDFILSVSKAQRLFITMSLGPFFIPVFDFPALFFDIGLCNTVHFFPGQSLRPWFCVFLCLDQHYSVIFTQMDRSSSETVHVAYVAHGKGRTKMQCFNCKEFEHIAPTCPKILSHAASELSLTSVLDCCSICFFVFRTTHCKL